MTVQQIAARVTMNKTRPQVASSRLHMRYVDGAHEGRRQKMCVQ